jgi:hypothetical protein
MLSAMLRTMPQAADVLNICLLETLWPTVNVLLLLLISQNVELIWIAQAAWLVLRMNV